MVKRFPKSSAPWIAAAPGRSATPVPNQRPEPALSALPNQPETRGNPGDEVADAPIERLLA